MGKDERKKEEEANRSSLQGFESLPTHGVKNSREGLRRNGVEEFGKSNLTLRDDMLRTILLAIHYDSYVCTEYGALVHYLSLSD